MKGSPGISHKNANSEEYRMTASKTLISISVYLDRVCDTRVRKFHK
jgi:hypothetical protein